MQRPALAITPLAYTLDPTQSHPHFSPFTLATMKSMIASLVFVVKAIAIALSFPAHKHDIIHTRYQFPNETWVENLAVRSNGNVLITLLSSPEVWEVDPSEEDSAKLVFHFPGALSALGIAELQPDIFVVAVGNITLPAIESEPGSYSAWKIDMRYQPRHRRKQQRTQSPRVSKIADIPQAHFLNGLCSLPGQPNTFLLADSAQGLIYALDTKTGASRTWLDDPAFKPNSSIPVKSGINGLHAYGEYLYFTNTFSAPALARVPIDEVSGEAAGPVETIIGAPSWKVNIGDQADDFTFDGEGNVWLATDPSNSIVKVEMPGGHATVEIGGADDCIVAGVTATAFGRTKNDQHILYATTNGGIAFPPPGDVVGGKVVAIDTSQLQSVNSVFR
jgi:hypothetical protein